MYTNIIVLLLEQVRFIRNFSNFCVLLIMIDSDSEFPKVDL